MKIKRFTYFLCVILVGALSLFPSKVVLANDKTTDTYSFPWYDEFGTCQDGSVLVDSEIITIKEDVFLDKDGEIIKIIQHWYVDAWFYVKDKPEMSLAADPFRYQTIVYLTPEMTVLQSGLWYKLTVPGLGNIYSVTGRVIWQWDDTLGEWVPVWQRGTWTPMPDVVNSLCTYFGLQ